MANTTGKRAEQVRSIVLSNNGNPVLIDDADLIDLWLNAGDVTDEEIIKLQQRVNATDVVVANLKSREDQIQTLCGILDLPAEELLEETVVRMARIFKGLMPEEVEGLRRFLRGESAQSSTGIHGGLTVGYGDLDANGFWQYPLPNVFVKASERSLKVYMNADALEAELRAVLLRVTTVIRYPALAKEIEGVLAKVERNRP